MLLEAQSFKNKASALVAWKRNSTVTAQRRRAEV
jgi:hypothetical protein